MSEPHSLYVKIKITKEKLQQFFLDKPLPQTVDDNWQSWWDSREMYAKQTLEHIPLYTVDSNRKLLDELLNDRGSGCLEAYDLHSQNWTFISVLFSENYIEILPMLALLKSLAHYQDSDGTGVAMIYDHLWGDGGVMAYLDFSGKQAVLKNYKTTTEMEPATLQKANETLETAMAQLNKQLED